jgi:hypothetical protein
MVRVIKDIFPDHIVYNDIHAKDLLYSSGRAAQLDVYIFNLALAFEYQGEQHYGISPYRRMNTERLQDRDEEKKLLCKANGITLIEVPFWWDGSREQLEATIAQKRPELVLSTRSPIPSKIALQKRGMLDEVYALRKVLYCSLDLQY